ncbi:MAG: hypothetical protein ACWA40_05490 [Planktomarina sp.]
MIQNILFKNRIVVLLTEFCRNGFWYFMVIHLGFCFVFMLIASFFKWLAIYHNDRLIVGVNATVLDYVLSVFVGTLLIMAGIFMIAMVLIWKRLLAVSLLGRKSDQEEQLV